MFGVSWTISTIVMSVVGSIGTIWAPFVVYFGIEKQLEACRDVATLITGAYRRRSNSCRKASSSWRPRLMYARCAAGREVVVAPSRCRIRRQRLVRVCAGGPRRCAGRMLRIVTVSGR